MNEDLEKFNNWYTKNYNFLMNFAKRYRISCDEVHDSYIKIAEKIEKTGYEGTTYMTYVKRSIQNLHINNCKKSKHHFVDVEDKDFRITIEMKLLEVDESQKDAIHYQDQLMYFSKMLFKYIDAQSYTDEEKFIFRSYYLLNGNGRMTYQKLTEITKINKNTLTEVLTRMKKDIKENLINWVNNNKND